jgi:hypothetical protein
MGLTLNRVRIVTAVVASTVAAGLCVAAFTTGSPAWGLMAMAWGGIASYRWTRCE